MQATLFWACAVAPKRLRRFAHAQNDLIWTAADATELDLAAAPNGGSVRSMMEQDRSHNVRRGSRAGCISRRHSSSGLLVCGELTGVFRR